MERSFIKAGKSMAHEMRHRIAMCKRTEDLENTFSEMSGKIISRVIGKEAAAVPVRGISLAAAGNHYTISKDLDEQQLFREAWYRSDLPVIIGRFAETAWHRYLHLKHSDARMNIKIRI